MFIFRIILKTACCTDARIYSTANNVTISDNHFQQITWLQVTGYKIEINASGVQCHSALHTSRSSETYTNFEVNQSDNPDYAQERETRTRFLQFIFIDNKIIIGSEYLGYRLLQFMRLQLSQCVWTRDMLLFHLFPE